MVCIQRTFAKGGGVVSKTSIEWTHPPGFDGETWNPTLGCSKISPGCKNCYAIRSVHRLAGNPNQKIASANAGLTVMTGAGLNWTGKVNAIESRLSIPLKKKRPTAYFVNSLSDLFHEDIPDEFIDRCFAVMAMCDQHRFMVLTKRADRLASYTRNLSDGCVGVSLAIVRTPYWDSPSSSPCAVGTIEERIERGPLPNLWLGVSVENQATADERIPALLKTAAAVRFVSYEPALGPVDFSRFLFSGVGSGRLGLLHQIIVGGESGPSSRPLDIDWPRQTIRQCEAADVACFVKQLGADPREGNAGGHCRNVDCAHPDCGYIRLKLKDKKGGLMDEWPADLRVRQFPEVAA